MSKQGWFIIIIPILLLAAVRLATRAGQPASEPPSEKAVILPMVEVTIEPQPTTTTGAPKVNAPQATPAQPALPAGGRRQVQFAANAFPPPLPDTDWHRDAWNRNDCMRCHETGVLDAPEVIHRGMPEILMSAKCRTCHVLIPGLKPPSQRNRPGTSAGSSSRFAANAFPPMMPNSQSHRQAWTRDDCLLCHRSGIQGAPIVRHEGWPALLLEAKCRSCHVQVRAIDRPADQPADQW